MPVTQIPSRDPSSSSPVQAPPPEQRDLFAAEHWETAYRSFNPDDVPHLLLQLQDDLSRARKREALWLSVILHLFVVILLWNSEKLVALFPHRTVPLELRADADREKDATFLELPPDAQKPTRRPDAKIASDKDRIATTKTPQINREELRKLLQCTHQQRNKIGQQFSHLHTLIQLDLDWDAIRVAQPGGSVLTEPILAEPTCRSPTCSLC
jgi:hypothetical protein